MGKKSRLKRERKLEEAAAPKSRPNCFEAAAQPFTAADGRQILIFDGTGRVQGPKDARPEFWVSVCAAIADDDAALMDQLAGMGALMGLSIFDVEVPVYPEGAECEQSMDLLPLALVKLKRLACFRWLLDVMVSPSCPHFGEAFMTSYTDAIELLVHAEGNDPNYGAPESMARRMCEIFARHILETPPKGMDPLGLEVFKFNSTFRGELARFRQEKLARDESALIEAEIPIVLDENPEPIGFGRSARSGSALRI